ncbi:DUF1127 domain-containing protein [Sulfitobacter sp. SK011]|uniref:DUF1127 domain-containing protein n=1 Tax=Sulfitobacter sp. SK011 TaxID=1389004 RepID=UPI0020C7D1B0|nr:DUF1127 domain-containing protein [Sulfitobacter sp. SK011]
MSMVTSQNKMWSKSIPGSLQAYFADLIIAAKVAKARRARYRETYSELSALSDRDLADIGIARSYIRRLAIEESMKVTSA